MSRDTGKDLSASPETEQLLSADARGNTSNTHVRQPGERWSTDASYLQGDVSSSRSTTRQNKFNHDAQIEATSSNSTTVIPLSSSIVNDNDDNPPPYTAVPPPYSAIALSNHVGWPYGLFSFDDSYSTDGTTCRMEIPLTPFQASVTPSTGFHHEGINCQHASFPMPLTSYQFFKYGCRRSSYVSGETSFPDNEIVEKIDDRKSRRCGVILVAAAVIVFLMVLSLMVRFVMEKSWWRR